MKSLNTLLRAGGITAIVGLIPVVAAAADHPFMVQGPLNAQIPFTVTMPTKTEDGKAAKTAVIKFVSADCVAEPGTPSLGTAQITSAFNGANGFFRLPFATPQVFVNNTEFTIAQQTLIFAGAGSPLDFGLSAGASNCTAVFTGNLLTKDN